jgi:hypothetical protein
MGYRYQMIVKDLLQRHEQEQQDGLVVKELGKWCMAKAKL